MVVAASVTLARTYRSQSAGARVFRTVAATPVVEPAMVLLANVLATVENALVVLDSMMNVTPPVAADGAIVLDSAGTESSSVKSSGL